jgi:hypothetical protein
VAVPELSDIENATIRAEIEEWLDRPEEIERNVELFAGASSAMQAIAAAIIEGDNEAVDRRSSSYRLAEDALLGRDENCLTYIKAWRAGDLPPFKAPDGS